MTTPPPRRVVITSPRTRLGRTPDRSRSVDLEAESPVGEVYLRSLMRTQLRLASIVCGIVLTVGIALPLLFEFAPETGRAEVFGLRLPWLLLGGLAFPAMAIGGWLYVRQAERNEDEFVALARGPRGRAGR